MMAGKTKLDTGALTSEQQDKLRQFKVVNIQETRRRVRSWDVNTINLS